MGLLSGGDDDQIKMLYLLSMDISIKINMIFFFENEYEIIKLISLVGLLSLILTH